jgi:adenylate cyclase
LTYLKTPWNRNQIIALAQLTRMDALYQAAGEDSAATVQVCSNALRERAAAYGGKVHPSASHQTLVTFHNPRRALDWVEQTSNLVMTLTSGLPLNARPGLVVGFDYADTTEIEGTLHSVAVSRVERLTWGRTDEMVFTQAAVPAIPDELKGRISRVPAPKDLGAVWRIGVKETSVMSSLETQQLKIPSRFGGMDAPSLDGPRPLLTLEVLDRKIEVGSLDAPMIFGRGVAEGLEIPDPRVSRLHAIIEPRGTVFVLVDSSSNGTWVQFDGAPAPVELRQQECALHGSGVISFGISPNDFSAPTVRFAITIPTGFVNSRSSASTMGASGFRDSGGLGGASSFGKTGPGKGSDFGASGFTNTTKRGPLR